MSERESGQRLWDGGMHLFNYFRRKICVSGGKCMYLHPSRFVSRADRTLEECLLSADAIGS
jgi:hypothetical protein